MCLHVSFEHIPAHIENPKTLEGLYVFFSFSFMNCLLALVALWAFPVSVVLFLSASLRECSHFSHPSILCFLFFCSCCSFLLHLPLHPSQICQPEPKHPSISKSFQWPFIIESNMSSPYDVIRCQFWKLLKQTTGNSLSLMIFRQNTSSHVGRYSSSGHVLVSQLC